MKNTLRLLTISVITTAIFSSCTQNDKAKYVFLFIGDGMGATQVAVTESYLSYKTGRLGGEQLVMTTFPYHGTATTHSANRHVTCSSASGTAIACGEKTNNGFVGVNKDTIVIKSMAYDLQEDGYNIGIISTVGINHATPASFFAHSDNRNKYYDISSQIPDSDFEFFAGAGFIDFKDRNGDKEATDLYLERNGYTVSYGIEEFQNECIGKDKVVFCQARNKKESAENYDSDAKEVEDATLAEMLELGLGFLGDDEPFFFMCEGGTIDWSCHDNRTMAMINDVVEFDNAIKVAYEFYLKHKDETLIVVTADHETGGITLGCGWSTVNWKKLEDQWIESGKKNILDSEANRQLNEECSIGWTTSAHTGGPVPVYALGKGAEKFTGRIDNTEIKGKILGE